MNNSLNHGDDERYTPIQYIESAKVVFGGTIDLDPASNVIANAKIRAKKIYTIEDNGILHKWVGNVWCNPPFSRIKGTDTTWQQLFVTKFVKEYKCGNMRQGIILLFGNALYTEYFLPLIDYPFVAHFKGMNFTSPFLVDRDNLRNGFGNLFSYAGPNVDSFVREFSKYGTPYRRIVT